MKLPLEGWRTLLAVVVMVALGVWEIYRGHSDAGVGWIVAALGLLGVGGKLDRVHSAIQTGNEVGARQVEALTQQPASEAIAEAKAASGETPDPNLERQGRSCR